MARKTYRISEEVLRSVAEGRAKIMGKKVEFGKYKVIRRWVWLFV